MSFSQAISSALNNYAIFSGRARRSEYWYFMLFNMLVSLAVGLIGGIVGIEGILSGIASSALLVPSLAACWRRLHDIGKSGAW